MNDLDSIATILSFGANLVWGALPRQGLFLRSREYDMCFGAWGRVRVGADGDNGG